MREKFAHWDVLFKEYLKRDWKLLVFWIVCLGGFCGGFVPAFVEIGKGQGLIGLYETMKNPAMISMVGVTPIKDAADYTIGAMYSHMMLVFCGLFAMIITAMHVVSHTRKEEENGLKEFVGTYCIGRYADSFALMMEEVLVHGVLALLIGGLMAAFRVETVEAGPCFLFGASIALAGLIGGVIAFLMAQIMVTSTGTTGSSLAVIGMLYLLRAGTDVKNLDLSMFNPMGWTYLTFPFTENNVLPLIYGIIFCAVLAVFSLCLEHGRDMGAGYLPEIRGSKKVKKSVLSVHGLLLRLNRTIIISWVVGFFILGGAYGSIYGDMQTFLESSELIKMMFTMEGVAIEASFTSVILVVLVGLTAILPIAVINKMFTEESASHFGQLYAAKVSRGKMYWTAVFIAVLSGTIAIAAASGGLGGAAVAVMEDSSMKFTDFIKAGMNYFPAVLFVTSLTALFLGWIPKFGKLLYLYVGYSFLMNYLHNILDLPDWFEKTAVLSWIPRMPVDEFDGVVFAVITGISVVIIIIGYVGYQRRDLIE